MLFPLLTPDSPLVLVGAGNMGAALLAGWLGNGVKPEAIIVVDPSPTFDNSEMMRVRGIRHEALPPADVVARALFLAVKPQVMSAALPSLRTLVGPSTVTVSIAAGTTVATLEAALGGTIVRAMPNTPAQIGLGATGVFANKTLAGADWTLVNNLLGAVGIVAWVDSEGLIDAITAMSGSGPAYVFHLAHALATAGMAAGLPPDIAVPFARQTVAGAGELLVKSHMTVEDLRESVTSPNGTTAAALAVLMAEDGLLPLLVRAVAAAKKRAEELAG